MDFCTGAGLYWHGWTGALRGKTASLNKEQPANDGVSSFWGILTLSVNTISAQFVPDLHYGEIKFHDLMKIGYRYLIIKFIAMK